MYAAMGIDENALQSYEKLQYDIMFGKQYGYGDWAGTIKDPNYVLGPGKLEIEDIQVQASGDDQVVKVSGQNLPHNGVVLINGQPAVTECKKLGELTAVVTPEAAGSQEFNIEIVVKDSKDIVVATSNKVAYSANAANAANEVK